MATNQHGDSIEELARWLVAIRFPFTNSPTNSLIHQLTNSPSFFGYQPHMLQHPTVNPRDERVVEQYPVRLGVEPHHSRSQLRADRISGCRARSAHRAGLAPSDLMYSTSDAISASLSTPRNDGMNGS